MDIHDAERLLSECVRFCVIRVKAPLHYEIQQHFTRLYTDFSIHMLSKLEAFFDAPLTIDRNAPACLNLDGLYENVIALTSLFILTPLFDHRLSKRIHNRITIAEQWVVDLLEK